MQFRIHALQTRQGDLPLQNHLVQANHEVCIQELAMEDSKADTTSDKLEVVEVLRVDPRCRADLEGIATVLRVFE